VRTVDIRTLLGEYNDNQFRADSTFKGHVIQTSGFVGDVKRDLLGDAFIMLGVGGPFEVPMVQCVLSKAQAKKAASLSQCSRVTVRRRVSGLMMNVVVRECEFVGL
jgi:tRNA_anti-like